MITHTHTGVSVSSLVNTTVEKELSGYSDIRHFASLVFTLNGVVGGIIYDSDETCH